MSWRYGVSLLLLLTSCKEATLVSEQQRPNIPQASMLAPLPMPAAVAAHSYQGQQYASPFTPLIEEAYVTATVPAQPDVSSKNILCRLPVMSAPRVLADYPLDELSLRGILAQGQRRSALLYHPKGGVYSASLGQGVSQQTVKVTEIGMKSVQLTEYIENGQGCWYARRTQLALWVAAD